MEVTTPLLVALLAAGAAYAQEFPVPPAPAPPAPEAGQAAPKAAELPVEKPPLMNTGKPMVVQYECSEEDVQSNGLTCTAEDPCPMYLELSAVESVGNRIFLGGNLHSSSTTLYSILLSSDDTGKTWREPHPRIRSAVLDEVQFVDFENGWVSGEVMHPLPRDPFLLITSDGGKTWHERALFGDTQFGAITQFWFSSRANGTLLIDRGQPGGNGRYEVYVTSNGGESWMLREASGRLSKLRRPGGSVNEDWRIRADAASKSFSIERHAGDKWHTVARFSVSIGSCKPPDHQIPSEAPPVGQ